MFCSGRTIAVRWSGAELSKSRSVVDMTATISLTGFRTSTSERKRGRVSDGPAKLGDGAWNQFQAHERGARVRTLEMRHNLRGEAEARVVFRPANDDDSAPAISATQLDPIDN